MAPIILGISDAIVGSGVAAGVSGCDLPQGTQLQGDVFSALVAGGKLVLVRDRVVERVVPDGEAEPTAVAQAQVGLGADGAK